ncbi:MAG: hypothetical protein C0607_14910 [Azoarcus sp.]|nr:MAG: hypothetical protein C0607_14910 [Azoarcus sp.]
MEMSSMKLIERIFGKSKGLADSGKDGGAQAPSDATARTEHWQALRGKVQQMNAEAATQQRLGVSLRAQMERLGKQRVSLMAKAKLSDEPDSVEARALEDEIEQIRARIKDADELAAEFEEMARQHASELKAAAAAARKELGDRLDQMFETAATAYNESARAAAEHALILQAVKELMISKGCGNSNGFDPLIVLPMARPGDGGTFDPIINSATPGYLSMVRSAQADVAQKLKADGFEV